jgi:hypothetical protein
MAKLLTSLAVAHAKPYRRDGIAVLSEIRDGGCRGLRLLVHPTGHRTFGSAALCTRRMHNPLFYF